MPFFYLLINHSLLEIKKKFGFIILEIQKLLKMLLGMADLYSKKTIKENLGLVLLVKELEPVYGIRVKIRKAMNLIMEQL